MGRAERRKQARIKREFDRVDRYRQMNAVGDILDEQIANVAREVEIYTMHHITGEINTALAVVLRSYPYNWSAEKVMRLLSKVGGIINDLNDKKISDSDLVTAGEKKGIRVLWDAKHEYIDQLGIFEE